MSVIAAMHGLLSAGAAPAGWVTTRTMPGSEGSFGWGGYTLRQVMPSSDAGGVYFPACSRLRLTLQAGAPGLLIEEAWVQRRGAPDSFDFAGSPLQITFGGAPGVSIGPNATAVTDDIELALSGAEDIVLGVYFGGGDTVRSSMGYTPWRKTETAGNHAADEILATHGTVHSGYCYLVSKIEVFQP